MIQIPVWGSFVKAVMIVLGLSASGIVEVVMAWWFFRGKFVEQAKFFLIVLVVNGLNRWLELIHSMMMRAYLESEQFFSLVVFGYVVFFLLVVGLDFVGYLFFLSKWKGVFKPKVTHKSLLRFCVVGNVASLLVGIWFDPIWIQSLIAKFNLYPFTP